MLNELTIETVALQLALTVTTTQGGTTALQTTRTGTTLTFTAAEWEAFVAGARAHEFDPPALVLSA